MQRAKAHVATQQALAAPSLRRRHSHLPASIRLPIIHKQVEYTVDVALHERTKVSLFFEQGTRRSDNVVGVCSELGAFGR